MYHSDIKLQEGAFFISDVHYNHKRKDFEKFLNDLLKNPPSQLFLLGDIFDFLSSEIDYFINKNQVIINLLNQLSLDIQNIILPLIPIKLK